MISGRGDETTTSETKIPDPTPEERALMGMMTDGLMTAYIEDAGYDVEKTETTWESSSEYQSFQDRRRNLQNQLDTAKTKPTSPFGAVGGASAFQNQMQVNTIQSQLNELDEEERKAREGFEPKIEYKTRKKADLATEQIREQYGEDSPEYKEALAKYEGEKIAREEQSQRITQLAMDQTEKFLKGDYSLNADQEKWVNDTLGPIKQAGLNAVKYLKDEAAASEGKINTAIDSFAEEVKKTGMSMTDAIVELEERTRTTGANMKTALEESLAQSKAMTEMGIQDFSLATRKSIAAKAASLGRSPTDPAFVAEMQEQVTKEIQRTGLAYGQMSAEGRMAIEERTGAGLEEAARLRGQVAERTGAGLESAAQMRIGTKERTASIMEEAARMKGSQEIGLAEAGANLRKDIGMGQVPGTVGLGLDVDRYNQAVNAVQMQNTGAAMNAIAMPVSWYTQERMAEPTTTTTRSGGIGSFLGGLFGTGAAVASTMATGGFGSTAAGWFGNKAATGAGTPIRT